MSSAAARDALILKQLNDGAGEAAARQGLRCSGGAVAHAVTTEEPIASQAAPAVTPVRSRGPRAFEWTAERIERAKRMWLAGESAAVIGKALSVSRNAVIGKLGRLGVARSEEINRKNRMTGARAGAAAAAEGRRLALVEATLQASPQPAPTPAKRMRRPVRETLSATTDLLGLSAHMCRWPIGEPEDARFGFCGRASGRGPYCAVHGRRAYQSGPLEPIERVAGLKAARPPEPQEPAVFDAWARG